MPRIAFSKQANEDLTRLAKFIEKIDLNLSNKAINIILDGIEYLADFPLIAPASDEEKYLGMRELFVPFGKGGYLVLYEFDMDNDVVIVGAIRHTKEVDFN